MAQFARPCEDLSDITYCRGGNPYLSTDIYRNIDETPGDTESYIYTYSSNDPSPLFALTSVNDPGVTTGHVLRIRAHNNACQGFKTLIRIYCGDTRIFGVYHTFDDKETYEYTLSSYNANKITDYSDLRFSVLTTIGMRVYDFEFEVPDAPVACVMPPLMVANF